MDSFNQSRADAINAATGVNYALMDEAKRYAESAAATTASNAEAHRFSEVTASRGEPAYVIDRGEYYEAKTIEGLGTKNLIADLLVKADIANQAPDKSKIGEYYHNIGIDTIATFVNDLITVGATPEVVMAHWAVGGPQWFENKPRWQGLVDGWKDGCDQAGAVWGPGETAELRGIIYPDAIELSGAATGRIYPKERLTAGGEKLKAGDRIILIESSGIHANGLTKTRDIAEMLPEGFMTPLPSGKSFGEALLTPTHIYANLQKALFDAGIDIHYMANITGHGWRKFMRADQDFTYRIHTLPIPQEEFELIQKTGNFSDKQMYAAFNMGAGFAFYVSEQQAQQVLDVTTQMGYKSWDAGVVEEGSKQVIIEMQEKRNIIFTEDTLQIS